MAKTTLVVFYPDDKMRGVDECRENSRKIREALERFGFDADDEHVIDVSEDGSALRGKRTILPPGSINVHIHEWGPVEHSRITGNPHRKCQVPGCSDVSLDLDDDE